MICVIISAAAIGAPHSQRPIVFTKQPLRAPRKIFIDNHGRYMATSNLRSPVWLWNLRADTRQPCGEFSRYADSVIFHAQASIVSTSMPVGTQVYRWNPLRPSRATALPSNFTAYTGDKIIEPINVSTPAAMTEHGLIGGCLDTLMQWQMPEGRLTAERKLDYTLTFLSAASGGSNVVASGESRKGSVIELLSAKSLRPIWKYSLAQQVLAMASLRDTILLGLADGRLVQLTPAVQPLRVVARGRHPIVGIYSGKRLAVSIDGQGTVTLYGIHGSHLQRLYCIQEDSQALFYSVAMSPDEGVLMTQTWSHVNFWSTSGGQLLATLYHFGGNDEDWVVIAPDGSFDASPRAPIRLSGRAHRVPALLQKILTPPSATSLVRGFCP